MVEHNPEKCGCKYMGLDAWSCGHIDNDSLESIEHDQDFDSVRDVMKDRMRSLLRSHEGVNLGENAIYELACDIADEAFSVCGISAKEQDEPWKL